MLVAPVIIKTQSFMHKLWLLQLNWDDFLTKKEAKEWRVFSAVLQLINYIAISCCILLKDAIMIELHVFSKTSKAAHEEAIYRK